MMGIAIGASMTARWVAFAQAGPVFEVLPAIGGRGVGPPAA